MTVWCVCCYKEENLLQLKIWETFWFCRIVMMACLKFMRVTVSIFLWNIIFYLASKCISRIWFMFMPSVMMNDGLACFFSVKLPRLKQIKRLNVFCVSDDHLSALMTRTRPARQSWIETAKPHITDIHAWLIYLDQLVQFFVLSYSNNLWVCWPCIVYQHPLQGWRQTWAKGHSPQNVA